MFCKLDCLHVQCFTNVALVLEVQVDWWLRVSGFDKLDKCVYAFEVDLAVWSG